MTEWAASVIRRLAAANSASAFVVDHVTNCLTSSLITMQNLVAVSHCVGHVGGPKNLGDAESPPF